MCAVRFLLGSYVGLENGFSALIAKSKAEPQFLHDLVFRPEKAAEAIDDPGLKSAVHGINADSINGKTQMTTPATSTGQNYASTEEAIAALTEKAQPGSHFASLLTASLQQANTIAQAQLDRALYDALKWWPVDIKGYVAYLKWFARWIPQQSNDPAWIKPDDDEHLKPGSEEHQEVYDRLCHFYWLIGQEVGPEDQKTAVENIPWFAEWLVGYAKIWGSFLDTTDSFNQDILDSFIDNSPMYAVEDSMIGDKPNKPGGWRTFNQFFARELNPGLRPIASPSDNVVVTSPADCTFKAMYAIDSDSKIPEIWIKKTHKFASIEDLLEGSQYKSAFANGMFAHYFLNTYSYHRFHTPVAGVVRECYPVQGLVYLNVKIANNQFDAPDASDASEGGIAGYEFAQARGIIIVDTTGSEYGDVGIVATIPIGMCQVSSVHMTATVGSNLLKGDEFGNFFFGGSDIIVLFQAGTKAQIDTGQQYRHYGTPIATCDKMSARKAK